MTAAQIFERIREIIDVLDGVAAAGRKAALAAVPVAAFATAACFPVLAYGMPHADYELDGVVVSAETGEPIPGIEVELEAANAVVATSDAAGAWSLRVSGASFCLPDACRVVARDVDGAENGAFQDLEIAVPLTRARRGSGDWDEGTWVARDVELILEPVER